MSDLKIFTGTNSLNLGEKIANLLNVGLSPTTHSRFTLVRLIRYGTCFGSKQNVCSNPTRETSLITGIAQLVER